MGKNNLASEILKMVKEKPGTSFAELARIDGVPGDFNIKWEPEDGSNIILWSGVSQAAVAAIHQLVKEKLIEIQSSSLLVYLIDGCTLSLPVAKSIRHFKRPRWLPVTFKAVGA